jgi:hypothetical protein
MSTQTLPVPGSIGTSQVRHGGFGAGVRTFIEAIADSLSAAHEYKRLVAAGMQPTDAARKVFETKIDAR